VRRLSTNVLAGVAGGMPGSRCTGLDSGCAATLTANCQTDFCEPTYECTNECNTMYPCGGTETRSSVDRGDDRIVIR
jgi:hypothetical protein